jgi:hypothetical protein
VDEFHLQVRTAVKDRIAEMFAAESPALEIPVVEQDKLDPAVLDLPVVVVSFDAGQESIVGGTNASDYIGFPSMVSFLSITPDKGEDPTGARTTKVKEVLRRGFNQKRIAALPEVYVCTIDGAGPPVDERPIEQLRLQAVVTAYARVTR